jgi:lipid-A-disaccharide synthase
MIVAGEPSGDAHAAALVRALREEAGGDGRLQFFGATGATMREAGVESIVRSDDLSIMGLAEIAGALPKFWRAYRALKRAAIERRPEAVVLVDWPDFNLRLARALHRQGLRVIYYISPQLWAWRSYRIHSIRRDVDLLLAILPFEPDWYRRRNVEHVRFIGHPLVGETVARYGREEFCRRNGLDSSRPVVALLPGSRRKELERILPEMLGAAHIISRDLPGTQFVVALAANRTRAEADAIIEAASARDDDAQPIMSLTLTQFETLEALAAADAAAVASGTATLEAAIIDTPFVIVYNESFVNWHTLGRLIRAEHFGLINLIAGERLVTELMQTELTGERLAGELKNLLNAERNEAERARLKEAAARLGTGGASRRAALAVLDALKQWK